MTGRILKAAALSAAATCLAAAATAGDAAPAREFRAAWVATVYNLDWPSKPGLSASAQQAQLRAILDKAASLNLNAILFQVRSASDALYESKREPWASALTGTQGASPGYDPLAFAIAEAHKRGLELHAWCNPFRAAPNAKASFSSKHISRTRAEWVRRHGNQLWLDPGDPAAREYVLTEMLDIARRYPVDGIHIDDYFYPYPVKGGGSFPDDATWKKYGERSGMSRGDWRRDNVNRFVEALHRGIKSARPSAKFGISPFGIWRPGVPATIEAQLDSFDQLFADSRLWLERGWCDYMSPQLYWSISPAKQSFPVLLNWWRAQSRRGVPVWPGIATERVGSKRPAGEMVRQIELIRQGAGAPGHVHWSMKALMTNQGGVADLLKKEVYREPAGIPWR